jgi:hypothetical protein
MIFEATREPTVVSIRPAVRNSSMPAAVCSTACKKTPRGGDRI